MGFEEVAATVFPVFALAALGYVLGRFRRLDLASLTDVVVYVGGPSLVFTSLLDRTVSGRAVAELVLGVLVIVAAVGAMVRVAARITELDPAPLYLPAMFFNAGNMLLPLCLLAFGESGLAHAVVVFATMTLLQSTVGVTLASGRRNLGEALRLPYVYAVAAAAACRLGDLRPWPVLIAPLELAADLAVPLMLVALGVRLGGARIENWRAPALVSVTRIGGGYAAACVFVAATGLDGDARSVLLLASAMPAAVINFVFVEKYGGPSASVASAVAASTLVSFVTTPIVLAYGI